MGKRKLKTVFWVFLLLIVTGLIGCKQKEPEKEQLCHIVMEKGDGYQVTDPVRTIKSGSDVSFTVTLDNNWQLLGTDYHGETEIIKDDDGKTVEIVLHEVKYSESICIQAEKGKYEILYDANGGQNTSGDSDRVSICYRGTHQRINTSIGTDLFFRKGYTLLGWNTRADGSGQAVGLGSRIAWKAGLVLYAQWTPWTDEADFIYKKVSGFAVITGYSGKAQQICIPPSLGGLPVRTIRENAFADTDCKTVILSPGIYEIEKWAFRNSHLEQLYLYDDLEKIVAFLSQAEKKADEILSDAEEQCRMLKAAASEYCEDTLRRMEEAVADAYDEVKHSRAKFRSALSAASGGPAPRSQPAPRRAMYDAEADEDED